RSPRSMAVAVRRPNGEIEVLRRMIPVLGERYPILKWPVLRGAVVMIQALVLGISSLNFSAEAAFEDLAKQAAEKSKGAGTTGAQAQAASSPPGEGAATRDAAPAAAAKKESGKAATIAIGLSVVASIAVGMALFFLLPLALTDLVKRFVPA